MVGLILSLEFFLVFPFACLALGLGSMKMAVLFIVLGFLVIIFFLKVSRSLFIRSTDALAMAPDSVFSLMFFRILEKQRKKIPGKKMGVKLWVIPSSEATLQIWTDYSGKMEFFLSQGLIAQIEESGLEKMLSNEYPMAKILVSNRLHALTLVFRHLKGPFGHFRYWYVSFWLYPLEQLLKIATI